MKYIGLLCLLLFGQISFAQALDLSQLNKGLEYKNQGNLQNALLHFDAFLVQYPKVYPLAYFHRGYLHLSMKNYPKAIKDFEQLDQLDQRKTDAPYALGRTHLLRGDFEKAIAYFNATIQLNPFHANAYNDKGTALMQLRKFDLALTSFHKATSLKNDFPLAYNNTGAARYFKQDIAKPTKKDIQTARNFFSKAIEQDSKLMIAYRNRAAMSIFLKDYDWALRDLAEAKKLNAKDPMIPFYQGVIWADQNNYPQAMEAFDAAIQLNPHLPFVYEELGNLHKAKAAYKQAIQYYQEAKDARENMGKLYLGLMDYRIALVYAIQQREAKMYQFLKAARQQKVFKDMRVYQDFRKAKEFNTFRKAKKFKRFYRSIQKGTKDNKFLNPDLGWFRMRK